MIPAKITYISFFVVIALLVQACHAGNLQLVTGRRPRAEIVLGREASPVEKKSAAVLQDFISRITGATLPIVVAPSGNVPHLIFIGKAAAQADQEKYLPLKAEGYEIVARGGNLYLYGGSGKGLLYGVYELIEQKFGARKYDQGMPYVPKMPDLSVPDNMHMRYEPVFAYRESFYPSSADSEFLDWHHLQRFQDLWGLWGHSFFKMVSPERYFNEHPEYFAWNNGRRQPTQLCLSNPDVQRLIVSYLRKEITNHPDALYWSIAQMDGGGYCTCEKCQKADAADGGPQGSVIRFVNAVAAQFPERFFTTLAYGYSAEAPRVTRPAGNVYVILSTIDATRQQPLASDPQASAFRRQLEHWAKITPNLFVWDYTTQFTAYLSPFPMYDHYQANIRYFSEHGVKGVFEQGSGETLSDLSVYASYMQSKILWDPSLTAKDVETEFLQGYYGSASALIRRYIDQLITARNETDASLDIYSNPIAHRNDYLSREWMLKYKTTLVEAGNAVKYDSRLTDRVNVVRLGLEYVELEQARSYGTHPSGYLTVSPDGGVLVRPGWMDRVQQFVDNARHAGVIEFSETGGTSEDYLESWTDLMKRPESASLISGVRPSFSHAFIQDYPANGVMTLTDGIPGGRDFSYNWLLFADSLITITFPVGHNITPSQAKMNFLSDPGHYLFLPDAILIESSSDGKIYTRIGEKRLEPKKPEQNGARLYPITIPLTQRQLSYLRVTVQFPDRLPAWFEGSRHRKPLIAMDEIIISK